MENNNIDLKIEADKSWSINKGDGWYNGNSFIPFLPILELLPEKLEEIIKTVFPHEELKRVFPLEQIILTALETKRPYWVQKALEYIIKYDLRSEKIKGELIVLKENKDIYQSTRHKIQSFLNYCR